MLRQENLRQGKGKLMGHFVTPLDFKKACLKYQQMEAAEWFCSHELRHFCWGCLSKAVMQKMNLCMTNHCGFNALLQAL